MTELDAKGVAFLLNVAEEKNEREQLSALSAQRLFNYAERGADQPLDFDVERILRSNPKVRALYFQLKARQSIAYSELAAAASTDVFPRREIDAFEINVFEDEEHVFVVLQKRQEEDGDITMPSEIEIRHENGDGGSIVLPLPVDGKQIIALSTSDDDHTKFIDALKQPTTLLFLK